MEDTSIKNHYYARVEHYLEFDKPVSFREGGHILESGLRHDDDRLNQGAFQWAIRPLTDSEYELVLSLGFKSSLNDYSQAETEFGQSGFREDPGRFQRPIIETVMKRKFRDRAFAAQVTTAYDKRCAMTGLRLINGGGRAEVQAAHIIPVASDGPDSVSNGLALSGTVHWMFDRGLLSLDKDYTVLKAKSLIPDEIDYLLNRNNNKLIRPSRNAFLPAEKYLEFHRENIFKG